MGKKPQGPMTVDVFGNKISVAELEERNEAEAARVAAKARREAKANAIGASASSDVRNSGNRDGDGYTTAMDGASALTGTGTGIASLEDQLRALVVKTTNGGKLTGKEKRIFAKAEKDGRLPGVHDDENDQNLNLNDDENNSSKKNKHPALSAPESWARSLEAVSVHARNGLGGDNEANASDAVVDVSGLDVSIRGVRLIENGSLTIGRGAKVALLGANGSGKSTLVRLLAVGKIKTNVHDVACVSQELEASEASAFESLRECDHVSAELFKEEQGLIKKMDDDTCGVLSQEQLQLTANRLGEIAEKLNNRNAYDSESNATRILTGLGFDERKMHAPLSTLSGGWRMRAALAVALFIKPGLLLLDEPTNHLDLPAVIWLGSYLNSEHMRNTSVLMVTHSADFVGQVATHLVHLDHHKKRLTQQKHCDVWRFLAAAPERFRLEKKEYDEQQKTLKQLKQQGSSGEAAVKKVLKGAGGGKAKSKKDSAEDDSNCSLGGLLAKPSEYDVSFTFPASGDDRPTIAVLDAWYEISDPIEEEDLVTGKPSKPLVEFKNLRFSIHDKSRVVLVGPNGCGKSTLLKLLVGDLTPQKGEVSLHRDLKLGRHDQHHDGLFDGLLEEGTGKQSKEMSATKLLERKFGIQTQDARKLLGKAGLESNAHLTPCSKLSGGQKSRVAFAALCATSQNILILDEPTNHLDLESVEALVAGLNEFKGGVVISTHDARVVEGLDGCEVWVVGSTGKQSGDAIYGIEILPPGGFGKYRAQVALEVEEKVERAKQNEATRRSDAVKKGKR